MGSPRVRHCWAIKHAVTEDDVYISGWGPFSLLQRPWAGGALHPQPHTTRFVAETRLLLLRGQARPEDGPLSPRTRALAGGAPLGCGMGRAGGL